MLQFLLLRFSSSCFLPFQTSHYLFFVTVLSSSIYLSSDSNSKEVHDLLPKYGLPKGILPNNVNSYSLSDDGLFEIQLQTPCYVQFDQLVYYEKEIKGKLSYGSVSDVSGIQAKKLFLWLPVTGIKADEKSGMVEFFVGALSEKLPAAQFEDIPECKRKGCNRAFLEAV